MGWVTDEAGLKETKETYLKRRKTYLKTFPYFCVECSSFFYSYRYENSKKDSYCENCGSKGSIRKATKFDYDMVFKNKNQEKTEYKPSRKTDIYKYWEKDAAKKRAKRVTPYKKVKSGNFCFNCGKPLPPTWKVCAYCGQKTLDITTLQKTSTESDVKPVNSIIPQIEKQPPISSSPSKTQKEEEWKKKIVRAKQLEKEPKPVEKVPKQPIEVPISPPIPKKELEPAPEKIKKIEPQIITCPFCGFQINPNQSYCQQCGYISKK